MQQFSFLWQLLGQLAPHQSLLRRPLLLTLDALDDSDTHVLMEARSWAKGSLKLLGRVVDPVLRDLLDELNYDEQFRNSSIGLTPLDHERIVYLIGRLSALVRCDPIHFMQCAKGFPPSVDMQQAIDLHLKAALKTGEQLPTNAFLSTAMLDDYIDLLIVLSVHTLALGTRSHYAIGVAAAELAAALINGMASIPHQLSVNRLAKLCTSMLSPIIALIDICSEPDKNPAGQDPLMQVYSPASGYHVSDNSHLLLQVQLLGLLFALTRHAEPDWLGSGAKLLSSLQSLVKHGLERSRSTLARSYWIWFVRATLPFLGTATAQVASTALQQLCLLVCDGCSVSHDTGIMSHHFAAELGQLLEGITSILSECSMQVSECCQIYLNVSLPCSTRWTSVVVLPLQE